MKEYQKLKTILLIETTIKMLKLSSKHTGVKLNIIYDWKRFLSDLKGEGKCEHFILERDMDGQCNSCGKMVFENV